MTTADAYRKKAAKLRAMGQSAPDDVIAAQYEALGHAYLRLAEQAELNNRADVWAEFGPPPRLDEGEGA